MVMGTRANTVAKFILYESPLQMMADTPTNYEDEEESARFIASIPTTWDETHPIDGRVGEYIVMARKKGENWYLGAMSNESGRDISVELDFLPEGTYKAHVIRDGLNAHRHAEDYISETVTVNSGDSIQIKMAPSGGYALKLIPEK